MANERMWTYLSEVTPDYDYLLAIRCTTSMPIRGKKNQVALTGDDGQDTIVSLSNTSFWVMTVQWENITEAEAWTILDLYHDTLKGNGISSSWKFTDYGDSLGYIYTVKFMEEPELVVDGVNYSISQTKLKIIGRAPVA